jgi:hypothetical protein
MCLTLMFIFAIYMMIDLACLDCFLQDIILYISFKTFSFHDKKREKVLIWFLVMDVFDRGSSIYSMMCLINMNVLMCLLHIYSIIHQCVDLSFIITILLVFNGFFAHFREQVRIRTSSRPSFWFNTFMINFLVF